MSTPLPRPPRLPAIPPGTGSCGCCAGTEPVTPLEVANRPGLSAIHYRVGDYAAFRASLHAGLTSADRPELGRLQTRDDDDFTIALLDAFACAADVLTFYQERIANESYLATATQRVSLQEMGRLIGYRLRPGVAAETALAFTLEMPPRPPPGSTPEPGMFVTGVPGEIELEAGLAVRSVPAPGALPQVFETLETIRARPQWNAIAPWMGERMRPVRGATSTWLSGVATQLRAGDALLFAGAEFSANHESNRWDFRILDRVEEDAARNRTNVHWRRPLGSIDPPMETAAMPRVFALRRRAAVYGHNAPNWNTMSADFKAQYRQVFGDPVLLKLQSGISVDAIEAAAGGSLVGPLATEVATPEVTEQKREDWPRFTLSLVDAHVDLDAVYPDISSGSFVVLAHGSFNQEAAASAADTYVELFSITGASEVSREEFALSGKVTRLGLAGANLARFLTRVRETAVFAHSEELAFADYPVDTAVSGDQLPADIGADGLDAGRRVLVRGKRVTDDTALVHPATLRAITDAGAGRTVWTIDPPLPVALKRDTVFIHANVALASHGESVTQILGAGNAASEFQRFELRQLPLTHRAAPNEMGAAPELTLRVDDVAWNLRDSLFEAEAGARAFTLTSDEQGRQFVQFGDGRHGARLSSGVNNVRATYRKGIGAAGNVAADSLTQPMQRPLGLKGVSNPRAAEGGTDAEGADTARSTMPLGTRTLGRAVSLLDYEDFARAFAGIAKARATVLYLPGPVITITIAGPDGAVISPDSPIWKNLATALAANGDPNVDVKLLAHHAATFRVGLKVRRHPAFEAKKVLSEVEAALRARFSFAAQSLGDAVQQSEVITVAQGVRGVQAIDLDFLYGGSAPASQTQSSCQVRLLASRMHVMAGVAQPDEILTLHSGPFRRLEEMP